MSEMAGETQSTFVRRKLGRRRVAVIASLALVIVAAVAALMLLQGVVRQLNYVLETNEVGKSARELILALTDAETGQRGYLLALDKTYLEPYNAALSVVDARTKALLAATANSPAQRARIEGVLDAISGKRTELATTIALASSGRVDEARALFGSGAGNHLMEQIRETVVAFINTEDRLMAERNAQVHRLRIGLVVAILAALTGSVVLGYTLLMRTQRQMFDLARSKFALLSVNEDLEARVQERTAELEEARAHADRERARVEAVLQDTNHRVGNSLAAVSSLLALQLMRTQSQEVKDALEAARDRVHAIASGHRRLRLGDDLETTRADEFLSAVVEDLQSTRTGQRNITIHTDFEPLVIFARDATTLGIIVGELVTNALKHAFPDGRAGTVTVRLGRNGSGPVTLSVEDDGIGIADGAAEQSGLGGVIIRQLAKQLGGEPVYRRRDGGGAAVTVTLAELIKEPAAILEEEPS